MKLTEARDVFLEYRPIADIINGPLERAEKALKEYFREADKATYRSIGVQRGERESFDQALAKRLLGPAKVEECMVVRPTLGLVLPARLRKGSIELQHTLVPKGTSSTDGDE